MVAAQAPRRDFRQYRVPPKPTVQLDQGRIIAGQEDVQLLRELGLDTLEGAKKFRHGRVVREAAFRRTWRVETRVGILYVKIHHGVAWRYRVAHWRRPTSPARLEWENIQALLRSGFDMPEPVAVGEEAQPFGVPKHSFLVTREVQGEPLDGFLAKGWPDPHQLGALKAHEAVIKDVAGMIRRLHASGFYHRDLYCGHLIVTPDPRWGRPYMIDLARVEQRFPPRRRWLVKDLAAMESSAPDTVSRTDKLRFLLTYLCKSRLDPVAKSWAREVLSKSRQIRTHVPKYG